MTEHEKNVESVKRLGDAIGYGEMMVIASRLWQKKLEGMRLPKSGAFVPVILNKKKICTVDGKKYSIEKAKP
jgi:hypothetical protein